jgi:hypothetical protein
MVAPQACVAIEIASAPAAEQQAALERRCSDILGARRCRVVGPSDIAAASPGAPCWQVVVTTAGGDTPGEASVVLSDAADPAHAPVRRDVTFRPNDAVAERWATLGLVIAALVTVEEHSAAEAAPAPPWSAGGGSFAPGIEARREAPAPAPVPLTGEIRAAVVGALGLTPDLALGARVEGGLGWRWLALIARATMFPEGSRATFSARGAGGDVQLTAVGLGLCARGERGRLGARGCLGGDVERGRARGLGVSETTAVVAWWGAAWAAASAELRLHRHLALTLEVEGAVLYQRPTFAIHGAPSMFTTAPVAGALALGLAVPF